VWRYSYYGFLLPNTFYAKTGYEDQFLKGLYYCYKFCRESLAGGILLAFPAFLFLKDRSNAKVNFLFFMLAGYLVYVVLIGGDNLLVQRFFVPAAPLIFTLIALGISKFADEFKTSETVKLGMVIIIFFTSAVVIFDNRAFPMLGVSRTMSHYENLKKAAIWLKENSKPGESVAVESAGIIPYYSGLVSYDRLGLNDLHVSRKGQYGEGERDKSDEEYMMWEKRPDYFVDVFPTLYKKDRPDLKRDTLVYRYHSVPIGEGYIEDKPGIRETGMLYFNFYKKEIRTENN
jgi:hypothetical protein